MNTPKTNQLWSELEQLGWKRDRLPVSKIMASHEALELELASKADSPRYKVIPESQSGHCCFDFTVVDTRRPVIIGGEQFEGQFEAVCECFDENAANLVCNSLNAASKNETSAGTDASEKTL